MAKKEHSKLYRNIKALCRFHGIKMSDVEKGIYRQVGYLSRGKTVNAEELKKISQMFEVDMLDLMDRNFDDEVFIKETVDDIRSCIVDLKEYLTKDDLMKEIIRVMNEVYE